MIEYLKIVIRPRAYEEFLCLKVEVAQDGKCHTYENALPANDHLHSALDYMFVVAKKELENSLNQDRPLIFKDPKEVA